MLLVIVCLRCTKTTFPCSNYDKFADLHQLIELVSESRPTSFCGGHIERSPRADILERL